jgi:hypothetical protein
MKGSHLCPANGNRPAVQQPAERKVGSEGEDRWPKEAARRSALLGVHKRQNDPVRHAIPYDKGRYGRRQARAARVVVNVHGALTGIAGTVVRHVVVVMIAVVADIVTMTVMAMVAMAMVTAIANVDMVMIAIRVGVHQDVREDAGRRPKCHADDRRNRKHDRHRPDQGNAASARSLQSRQHSVR